MRFWMTHDKSLILLAFCRWVWLKCPNGLEEERDRRDDSRNEELVWHSIDCKDAES